MRRREFPKLSATGAIVLPWPVFAQKDLPLVAVLVPGTEKLANDRVVAIRKGMREQGATEGVHYNFVVRYADGVFDRLPGLANVFLSWAQSTIGKNCSCVPTR